MALPSPDAGEYKVTFTPIILELEKLNEVAVAEKLANSANVMERKRTWFGRGGIREQIGEKNGAIVETLLGIGSITLVEVGAGELEATKELAQIGSGNRIIAVEPFVVQSTTESLPENVTVLPKFVEAVSDEDIPPNSADVVVSGGYTINYPPDKLAFLKRIYGMLKPDSRAYVQFEGYLTNPSLLEIIDKFALEDIMSIEPGDKSGFVITMIKSASHNLDFGSYDAKVAHQGVCFEADTTTNYTFKE